MKAMHSVEKEFEDDNKKLLDNTNKLLNDSCKLYFIIFISKFKKIRDQCKNGEGQQEL